MWQNPALSTPPGGFLKYFVLLLTLVFAISCGKDEAALTSAPSGEPTPAPELVSEPAAPAVNADGSPALVNPSEEPAAPAAEPEPTKTRKELGERFGIKFTADEKCQVEDDGDVTLFKFGKGKVVTLHENGLMTAHDAAGKEWLHIENVKELFVLRENLGFLDNKGLFRYVWVGHRSLIAFNNATKLTIDNEGFIVFGETKEYTVIGGYRWDGATIVDNFFNPVSFELKANEVTATDKKGKAYRYPRTKVSEKKQK